MLKLQSKMSGEIFWLAAQLYQNRTMDTDRMRILKNGIRASPGVIKYRTARFTEFGVIGWAELIGLVVLSGTTNHWRKHLCKRCIQGRMQKKMGGGSLKWAANGADLQTPKASREVGLGRGIPLRIQQVSPSPADWGQGERRGLPHPGPQRSRGSKRLFITFWAPQNDLGEKKTQH